MRIKTKIRERQQNSKSSISILFDGHSCGVSHTSAFAPEISAPKDAQISFHAINKPYISTLPNETSKKMEMLIVSNFLEIANFILHPIFELLIIWKQKLKKWVQNEIRELKKKIETIKIYTFLMKVFF